MRYRAVVLDFDGTVVESVGVKDRAFETLFGAYPDKLPEIMRYHLSHNATVRYEKFRHITVEILGKEYDAETERKLGDEFSRLVFDRIVACEYVRGAREFLDFFRGRVPLYLVSMTPAPELERILRARGIDGYFAGVYPASWKKVSALADIAEREGVPVGAIVFIGDSPEDAEAAGEAGVDFIGRDSGRPFAKRAVRVFADMNAIRGALAS